MASLPMMQLSNYNFSDMYKRNSSWWASDGDGPLCSGPDNPQLKSRLNILQHLCQERPIYAVETRFGGTKYGKLVFSGERLFINSFSPEEPESTLGTRPRFIAFSELLAQLNKGSSELPKTAFLRASPIGGREDPFNVIIETDGVSPRAKNFVFLCSALKGASYKGEDMRGFPNSYEISPAPPPVIEGIRSDDLGTPLEEGGVIGMWETSSWFWIQLAYDPSNFCPKFGDVIGGLQRMRDLRRRDYMIEECGLIIDARF